MHETASRLQGGGRLMKIELKLEDDGAPILFFIDGYTTAHDRHIACYAHVGQHGESTRAYMRQCRKPATVQEKSRCFSLLMQWLRLPG